MRRVAFPCNNCIDCLLSTNVHIASHVKVVKREGNKLLLLLLLLLLLSSPVHIL